MWGKKQTNNSFFFFELLYFGKKLNGKKGRILFFIFEVASHTHFCCFYLNLLMFLINLHCLFAYIDIIIITIFITVVVFCCYYYYCYHFLA